MFGAVEIDDHARLHALRLLVADADDLDLVGAALEQLTAFGAASAWPIMQQTLFEPMSSTVTDAAWSERLQTGILLTAQPAHILFSAFLRAFVLVFPQLRRRRATFGVNWTTYGH
jgi:hypothetical protein